MVGVSARDCNDRRPGRGGFGPRPAARRLGRGERRHLLRGVPVRADQSTGRVSYIPNSFVFTKPVFNYTQGFPYIWDEMPILITFESDWEKAERILRRIVQEHTEHLSESATEKVKKASRNDGHSSAVFLR